MPSLPSAFYFHSIFLTDTLIEIWTGGDNRVEAPVHQAMNTLVVGWIPAIAQMREVEKEERMNLILRSLALTYLLNHQELLTEFYAESMDKTTLRSFYNTSVHPQGDGTYMLRSARYEEYGFLSPDDLTAGRLDETQPVETWNYKTPKQDEDVREFLEVVFVYSEEEFNNNEKYVPYARVKNKFAILRQIVLDLGYELK